MSYFDDILPKTGTISAYLGTNDPPGWIIMNGIARTNNADGRYNALNALGIGFDRAWRLASLILHVNILWNALHILKLYGNLYFAAIYFVIFLPILQNLFKLKNTRFSREPIIKMVNETNMPLFSLLFFLSIIAKYMKK